MKWPHNPRTFPKPDIHEKLYSSEETLTMKIIEEHDVLRKQSVASLMKEW